MVKSEIATDSLQTVFTPLAISRLERRALPGGEWESRELALQILRVLSGRCTVRNADRYEFRRAVRAAWETYLDAAFAGGVLAGKAGSERLSRLRCGDPYQVWGAMAECMVYWYLVGRLGLSVRTNVPGSRRSPDFLLTLDGGETVNVEVKAPVMMSRSRGGWTEAYPAALAQRMGQAVGQFGRDGMNLLVCAPRFSLPLWASRDAAVMVFYARQALQVTYDQETGELVGEPKAVVRADGAFLKRYAPAGDPRFTRIGAVLTLEEDGAERQSRILPRVKVVHKAVVLHNPHARRPLPVGIWGTRAELVRAGTTIRWADGAAVL